MGGSFREAWQYLPTELWQPLAEYSSGDDTAPLSLFSDLFEAADEFLAPRPSDKELEQVRNDPGQARQRFLALKGVDFATESAIVLFLEDANRVIVDYDMPPFAVLYKRLLGSALRKFNLRYRLDEPFTLRFLLTGSFNNLYGELHRVNATNRHLAGLLTDFEKAFDRYARSADGTDLKTCIAKASNYAEGLASATRGTAGTLGALADQLTDWPHDKVRDALKSVYKFCSDYPGIRHAGDPAGVRRDLAARDVTLASLLLVSFAGHLSPHVDENVVLGV